MISPDTKLHLVHDLDTAMQLKRWLGERRPEQVLAFDCETTGLDTQRDRVRLFQIGDQLVGWAVPFGDWRGLVCEVIRDWPHHWVAHNAVYDVAMLHREGIEMPLHRIHDTRLMAAVLEPEYSNALKAQAARHVDKHAAAGQRRLDQVMAQHKWTWPTVPIQLEGPASAYWIYGALDTVLTTHLMDVHWPQVQAVCPAAYDLELAVAWVCMRMQQRGVTCDRDFTSAKAAQYRDFVVDTEAYIQHRWGVRAGSSAEITQRLVDDGIELGEYTPGGALKLDRFVLEEVAPQHELASMVLKRRRAEKVESAFLSNFLRLSEHDGLLHPSINSVGGRGKSAGESGGQFGVLTTRMSMDNPNLQALPRVGDGNPVADVVRNCIVSRPAHTLVTADYDQVELRLLAHFADDPGLQAAFGGDTDAFTMLARQIYNEADLQRKDKRRNTTKTATYATSYGAGIPKFAASAKLPLGEAQAFMRQYHATYPGLRRRMKTLEAMARQQGYIELSTGRRIKPESGFEYKLMNSEIQGTAAVILKTAILAADAAGLGDWMILPVHDELILDVPDEHVPDATKLLVEAMEDLTGYAVPLTVGAATARRWGEKVAMA